MTEAEIILGIVRSLFPSLSAGDLVYHVVRERGGWITLEVCCGPARGGMMGNMDTDSGGPQDA